MNYRILVLFAHPALQKSRINRQLIAAIRDLENVTIHDLYEEYPDFYINVRREQRLLIDHDIIIFQHPFYWYGSPAILKQWEDLVLEFGFAYGPGGTNLQEKLVLSAITTGGPMSAYQRDGYNYFTIRELLTPFEQTARFCGMVYLPPFVVSGTLRIKDKEEIFEYSALYRRIVEDLRDGRVDLTLLRSLNYFNELAEKTSNLASPYGN
ncbi:MAG TPA: NAD(P)H-dependent oxidoreductase [Chthoniobacterales bacterium]|jgi:glutathione-regulated potassium-efflux system ancillary protein KefG|nr:NAD(P)H-dependent oxidoreductase [Chthoniobacterales bacterium]